MFVTKYKSYRDSEGVDVDIIDALTDPQNEKIIKRYRELNDKKNKDKLPCITVSGTVMGERKDEHLFHNGLICMDVDELNGESPEDVRAAFSKFSCCLYSSLSVSGNGVFAVIRTNANDVNHILVFNTLLKYFGNYGIVIDRATKNPSRLRFISYDENAYINRGATELDVSSLKAEVVVPCISKEHIPFESDDPRGEFAKYCKNYEADFYDGARNQWVHHKACKAKDKFNISKMQAEEVLIAYQQKDFPASEIKQAVRSAFR